MKSNKDYILEACIKTHTLISFVVSNSIRPKEKAQDTFISPSYELFQMPNHVGETLTDLDLSNMYYALRAYLFFSFLLHCVWYIFKERKERGNS